MQCVCFQFITLQILTNSLISVYVVVVLCLSFRGFVCLRPKVGYARACKITACFIRCRF